MELLHQSDVSKIAYDSAQKRLYHTWLDATRQMTEDQYKAEGAVLMKHLMASKPRTISADNRDMHFVIDPETQLWVSRKLSELTLGIKRMAVIIPAEALKRLSVEQIALEQTLDEVQQAGSQLAFRYFDDYDAAQKWLTEADA